MDVGRVGEVTQVAGRRAREELPDELTACVPSGSHVACRTWHVAYGMWQVAGGTRRGPARRPAPT